MIDFNYTAPELLPFRIQEVLDAPNEPHRIGGVVYVPEGEICDRTTLLEEIEGLTAERDELQATIDAMNNWQFYAMYKAKCEECEQLKKVVRTQADSFKKLEIELGKQ